MPNRFWAVTILALWGVSVGWLFWADVWPNLLIGDPPPYRIDLSREAAGGHVVRWEVYRNGVEVGEARTRVVKKGEDLYEVRNSMYFNRAFTYNVVGVSVRMVEMRTVQTVTAQGLFRGLSAHINLKINDDSLVRAFVEGTVQDGMFRPQMRIEAPPPIGSQEMAGEGVRVSEQSILSPLQPWSRLENIQPGQEWRMPYVDPLADALSVMKLGSGGPVLLQAGVLEAPEEFVWGSGRFSCWVVEYRDPRGKFTARTWVRKDDGLVLRQESTRKDLLSTREDDPIRDETLALVRVEE